MLERVAVALRCRGLQIACVVTRGNLQRVLHAHRAHAQRLDPQAQILRRAGRRSQIENVIHLARIEARANVPLLKPEARMTGEMGEVLQVPRRQIIHAKNGMAFAQQAVGKVRTKKAGSAGDENMHGQSSALQYLRSAISASVSVIVTASTLTPSALRVLPSFLVPLFACSLHFAACLPAPGTPSVCPRSHT